MRITFRLDNKLVKEVRKIAADRGTTLTGMVRAHLEQIVTENAKSEQKRRELEALERSFERVQFKLEKITWKREDLYER